MVGNGSSVTTQPLLLIFNSEKYEYWSINMKTLFKSQEKWDVVEQGITADGASANIAYDAWMTLQTVYKGSSKVRGEASNQIEKKEVASRGRGRGGFRGRGGHGTGHGKSKQAMQNKRKMRLSYSCPVMHTQQLHIWFLDSGCSNHMTGIKSLFTELDKSYKIKVRLEDDKQMQVEGKGTVTINNGHGNVKLLYSVYFIPHLSQNLLSVRQLMASRYSILFNDVSCVIRDKKTGQILV
ncbi:hypothetical protein Patl1_12101 [Pistacia atlantica]|uniref:Uncharacterized protein n=1 Tax=Pistacia atlantica TaxID=434234 RepID=A0ACC1A6M7_9ROSI|nr:hypothetical protein Patl1_12101 [Pistacia atlantica]